MNPMNQPYFEIGREAQNSLYVGNLDRKCTERLITEIFTQVAPVVRCKIITSASSDPYCFVEFESRELADKAMSMMNGRKVLGKPIKVNWATSNTGMRKDTSNHYHIFVGDLDVDIDTLTLKKFFVPFGQVSDARVVKDSVTGKSKGYGFVSFVIKEEAEKAIKDMSGAQLGTRSIRTGWAARKPSAPQGLVKPLDKKEVYNQSSLSNTTVYVGMLPVSVTEHTLREYYAKYGTIYDIKVFNDKGYAFIKYQDHEQATNAIVGTHSQVRIGENFVKCSWGRENTAEMQQTNAWQQQQYYQQYYQYYQQQAQPQSAQQYAMYNTTYQPHAQGVYYPQQQQQYGNQAMPMVQMQGYAGQMQGAGAGQQAQGQQQVMGMGHAGSAIAYPQGGAPAQTFAMQPAAGYQTQ